MASKAVELIVAAWREVNRAAADPHVAWRDREALQIAADHLRAAHVALTGEPRPTERETDGSGPEQESDSG